MITPTGDRTRYESFSFDDQVLYLYFDDGYRELKIDRKTLCSAALTETLAQIPGVDHVGIYSGGKPLAGAERKPARPLQRERLYQQRLGCEQYETVDFNALLCER